MTLTTTLCSALVGVLHGPDGSTTLDLCPRPVDRGPCPVHPDGPPDEVPERTVVPEPTGPGGIFDGFVTQFFSPAPDRPPAPPDPGGPVWPGSTAWPGL